MNVGDLKRLLAYLPDSMEIVVEAGGNRVPPRVQWNERGQWRHPCSDTDRARSDQRTPMNGRRLSEGRSRVS
jgi:hypothetical protein